MEIQHIGFETGDIMLVNKRNEKGEYSKLNRIIVWFMELYRRQERKRHPEWNAFLGGWISSHAATLIRRPTGLKVAEAVENGYRIRVFDNHYDFNRDEIVVLRRNKRYLYGEKLETEDYAEELAEVNNFYAYWVTFIYWPVYILTRINLFRKVNKFSLYCYGGALRVAARVNPGMFQEDMRMVSFFSLIVPGWTIIYDNRETKNI
jgi:hypothetical protein